jgi:Domain of unknown function (DUF1840)
MIYEFKSKATGNLIMTEVVGDMVLAACGRKGASSGVITVADMPVAIANLKAAVAASKAVEQAPSSATDPTDQTPQIGLAARALPFMEMLQRALAGDKDITWGA